VHLALALAVALSSISQESGDKKSFDPFAEEEEETAAEPELEEPVTSEQPAAPPGLEQPAKVSLDPEDTRAGVLVLILPDTAASASLAQRIGMETTKKLARKLSMKPIAVEDALAPGAAQRRREEIRTGMLSARKGMIAFEELDLEIAGAELENGINSLLAYTDELDAEARRTLESAIFVSAATALFEGQTPLAESIFVALLLLAPQYTPDAELYPSNVISRFNDLKARVEQRPTGGIVVSTNPAGADVYVDGTYRGASPIELAGLADGQHVVVVRRLGYKAFGTLAPVTADRNASIDVDLEAEEGAEPARSLETFLSRDPKRAIELAKKLGVARLAILAFDRRISGSHVEGLWIDGENGAVLVQVPSTAVVEDPDPAASAILAAIDRAVSAPLVKAEAERQEESGPVTEQWWFWAIAGTVVAAAAAAGTVAIVSAEDRERRPPGGGFILGL
jgi:hypothetical protein